MPESTGDSDINIKLISWNINGLTNEKLDQDVLGQYLNTFDIKALQETWLKQDNPISLESYVFHLFWTNLNPKALHGSGGISVFIKIICILNVLNYYLPPLACF